MTNNAFPWETQSSRARAAAHAADARASATVALAGGRAVAVARLCSLAGVGAAAAERLLVGHGWRLREAYDAARRETGVGNARGVWPVGGAARNVGNAGNSCYLGAVFCALFAEWDAWDGVVAAGAGGADGAGGSGVLARVLMMGGGGGGGGGAGVLRGTLREAVGRLRRGEAVGAAAMEAVRGALRGAGFPGGRKSQEDAAECFLWMVDGLGAPYLPMQERLLHDGLSEGGDERVCSERLVWLAVGGRGGEDSFLRGLEGYFVGDKLDGLRRDGGVVSAWRHRRVMPFYTPVASTGEVAGVNDARAFSALPVPFALRRFDGSGRKNRVRVPLPRVVDFGDFVEGGEGGRWALVLRSVVCHLGGSIEGGHYVAWTREPFKVGGQGGWRRWDDLAGGFARTVAEGSMGVEDAEEIERDGYLVFYELVPGDGSCDPRDAFFHVEDVDVRALADDDQSFARALQAMEFENVGAECHLQ